MADAPKINSTDTLRESYPKLNQAIDNANEALRNSEEALNTANQALANSENTQEQLDQIVIEGDSSVEAAQARVDADGNTYTTLKERLDTKEQSFSAQLAQTVQETAVVLKSKYNLKCDGTDTVSQLQDAIDDLATRYKKIIFPSNSVFTLTTSLVIPSNIHIDFNGAIFNAISDIRVSALKLSGSNTTIENATLKQGNRTYTAAAGVDGVELKPHQNVDNIKIKNIQVEGFHAGINILPQESYEVTNIVIEDCKTSYARTYGLSLGRARKISVRNHYATHNGNDGLKTVTRVSDLRVEGGYFSYNVDPIDTYADGIDLYAGGGNCTISGAVCEYNGGVGIHVLSGELNDVNYKDPVDGIIKNIVISDCICRNNTNAGFDALTKSSVSATTPYPSKIIYKGCISEGNRYGFNINGRHVTISDCIANNNLRHGIQLTDSIYITINNCQIIKNSLGSEGTHSGISLNGCTHVTINGGVINGSDDDTLRDEDGSALTKYHRYGIVIENTEASDHIFINLPIIKNYTDTRGVYIYNFTALENAKKMIVVRLMDIGSDPLNNQIGYIGSSLYKNGVYYVKKTDLNSTVWEQQV